MIYLNCKYCINYDYGCNICNPITENIHTHYNTCCNYYYYDKIKCICNPIGCIKCKYKAFIILRCKTGIDKYFQLNSPPIDFKLEKEYVIIKENNSNSYEKLFKLDFISETEKLRIKDLKDNKVITGIIEPIVNKCKIL